MIICLPGVPFEMKTMFSDCVLPKLKSKPSSQVVMTGKVRCFGISESVIAERLGDLMNRGRNPQINCTVQAGDICLHIFAKAEDQESTHRMIDRDRKQISDLLKDAIYGMDEDTLPAVVGDLLRQQNKTLSIAESCTGGLLGKLITDIPGSTEYFLGGWITYNNEAKVRDLGVPEEIIIQYGAVSEQAAASMAEGAARKSGSNMAVALTGIAGPGGAIRKKEVGLVYIGLCQDNSCQVRKYRFSPIGRGSVRLRAALSALNWIRLELKI